MLSEILPYDYYYCYVVLSADNISVVVFLTRKGGPVMYLVILGLFVCLVATVNRYGHGGTVSSPNHTFSWASLNKQLTSTLCTYFRL